VTTTQPSHFLNARAPECHPRELPRWPGWAECYICGYVKHQAWILSRLRFHSLAKPKPVHCLTETPNKGLAVFATKRLGAGAIILCERPIIVF
ncbi:hypothetical protein C8J56DRAFT_745520, partial [Mycena floridula]